jgi:MFS family permease
VARSSASSFFVGLTSQYSAIYPVGLEADSVRLGFLSSLGGAIITLVSTPMGWLMDRHSIKRFVLLAVVFTAGGSLALCTSLSFPLFSTSSPESLC